MQRHEQLHAVVKSGFGDCLMINFNKDWKTLYVGDAGDGNVDSDEPEQLRSDRLFATPGTSDPPFGVAAGPNAKF